MSFEPTFNTDRCQFQLGQPIWVKDNADKTAYIVRHAWRSMSGEWQVDVVPEHDLTGPYYTEKADFFTDKQKQSPSLHAAHKGIVYLTHTGKTVKSIKGGRS